MRGPRPTVERLDQPSAYFASRVSIRAVAAHLKSQQTSNIWDFLGGDIAEQAQAIR